MVSRKNVHHTPANAPSKSIALVLFSTVADTTWRLFIPSIGGTALGVWGDVRLETKPWLTVIGVSGGVIVSILLIIAQLKSIQQTKGDAIS